MGRKKWTYVHGRSWLLNHLSVRKQLCSLQFYVLEFSLEFGSEKGFAALKNSLKVICPVVYNSGP